MTTSADSAHAANTYALSRRALSEAPTYHDADLSESATARRRAERVAAARAAMAAAVPQPAPSTATSRQDVLASLAPRTADDVALQANERQKVQRLTDADRPLEFVIAEASTLRLAAILDGVETMPSVLASSAPREAAAELQARVFARLVALGHAAAVRASESEDAMALTDALTDMLTTGQRGEVGLATRQTLHRLAPEAYRAAFTDDVAVDWKAIERAESVPAASV